MVAEAEGRIVAHVGVWPVQLSTIRGRVQCVHLIDWAAGRANAGAGTAVYLAGQSLAPVSLVIGGSSEARRILPKMGFRAVGELKIYARPLRIWRQFLERRGCPLPRRTALLLRNAGWRLKAGLAAFPPWSTSGQAELSEAQVKPFLEGAPPDITVSYCDAASMNYLLACPSVPVTVRSAMEQGEPRALFVLAQPGAQLRVADIRLAAEPPEAWESAYSTVLRLASGMAHVHEVVAGSTTPVTDAALEANGFHVTAAKPLWIRDGGRVLNGCEPFRLQLADSDGFLIYDPEEPYLT
jgi:hypothetical protein